MDKCNKNPSPYFQFKPVVRLIFIIWALSLNPAYAKALPPEKANNAALFKLQEFKKELSANYADSSDISVSLVNLNSKVNSWHLLRLTNKDKAEITYNILSLDNKYKLELDESSPKLLISDNGEEIYSCDIQDEITEKYKKRKKPKLSYFPVCNNLLFIAVKQDGFQPLIEKGAEVVRWLGGDAGETFINRVKETLFKDKYIIKEQTEKTSDQSVTTETNGAPPRAAIEAKYLKTIIPTKHLGLMPAKAEKKLLAGQWYPLKNFKSIYTSMIMPGMVAKEIQSSFRKRVNRLDSVERNAVVYLMAVDLDKYTLGWGHGTDHPGVGWSKRAVNIVKDNPYGPDGFDKMNPLIPLGHVPPFYWKKTIGTFSGGFQKRHSAFRYGELSKINKAHHYGFMENGVMLTSPTEGLATVIMYRDGSVDLKRWTAQDNEKLPNIRHLRQNGVPLLYRDEKGEVVPSKLVKYWGKGNWSGSARKEFRTPRGAACLLETPEDRFLIYAYFSGATPSAIARVFQAYGCNAAIHLDLNSPGQAYASLFTATGKESGFEIEHLMTKMYQHMGDTAGTPRYFIKPDYKDFFYIMKKD